MAVESRITSRCDSHIIRAKYSLTFLESALEYKLAHCACSFHWLFDESFNCHVRWCYFSPFIRLLHLWCNYFFFALEGPGSSSHKDRSTRMNLTRIRKHASAEFFGRFLQFCFKRTTHCIEQCNVCHWVLYIWIAYLMTTRRTTVNINTHKSWPAYCEKFGRMNASSIPIKRWTIFVFAFFLMTNQINQANIINIPLYLVSKMTLAFLFTPLNPHFLHLLANGH